MPFEEGNQLAAKGRKIEKMIERACLQEDDKRIRLGVEKLLDMYADGDKWALQFVTEKLDGKAAQTTVLAGDDENPLKLIHQVQLIALK